MTTSTPLPTVSGTAGAPPAAVQVRGVSHTFSTRRGSVQALEGIDLTLAKGEFVSLIGPSGCGKSTLLRLVADLVTATSGDVRVNGKPARQARRDHDYGIAFQSAGLLEWRTVARNVELPLELHGQDRARRRARAAELLELVGLSDVGGARPSELSGGMQQRVAIARALAESPSLLLMDEPFGALDEMTRERMQAELLRITAAAGTTVLFVTHSIPEAVYLSDRVVVMSPRPGRITEVVDIGRRTAADPSADPDDVREAPEFFDRITRVREALRGEAATPRGRGVEDR